MRCFFIFVIICFTLTISLRGAIPLTRPQSEQNIFLDNDGPLGQQSTPPSAKRAIQPTNDTDTITQPDNTIQVSPTIMNGQNDDNNQSTPNNNTLNKEKSDIAPLDEIIVIESYQVSPIMGAALYFTFHVRFGLQFESLLSFSKFGSIQVIPSQLISSCDSCQVTETYHSQFLIPDTQLCSRSCTIKPSRLPNPSAQGQIGWYDAVFTVKVSSLSVIHFKPGFFDVEISLQNSQNRQIKSTHSFPITHVAFAHISTTQESLSAGFLPHAFLFDVVDYPYENPSRKTPFLGPPPLKQSLNIPENYFHLHVFQRPFNLANHIRVEIDSFKSVTISVTLPPTYKWEYHISDDSTYKLNSQKERILNNSYKDVGDKYSISDEYQAIIEGKSPYCLYNLAKPIEFIQGGEGNYNTWSLTVPIDIFVRDRRAGTATSFSFTCYNIFVVPLFQTHHRAGTVLEDYGEMFHISYNFTRRDSSLFNSNVIANVDDNDDGPDLLSLHTSLILNKPFSSLTSSPPTNPSSLICMGYQGYFYGPSFIRCALAHPLAMTQSWAITLGFPAIEKEMSFYKMMAMSHQSSPNHLSSDPSCNSVLQTNEFSSSGLLGAISVRYVNKPLDPSMCSPRPSQLVLISSIAPSLDAEPLVLSEDTHPVGFEFAVGFTPIENATYRTTPFYVPQTMITHYPLSIEDSLVKSMEHLNDIVLSHVVPFTIRPNSISFAVNSHPQTYKDPQSIDEHWDYPERVVFTKVRFWDATRLLQFTVPFDYDQSTPCTIRRTGREPTSPLPISPSQLRFYKFRSPLFPDINDISLVPLPLPSTYNVDIIEISDLDIIFHSGGSSKRDLTATWVFLCTFPQIGFAEHENVLDPTPIFASMSTLDRIGTVDTVTYNELHFEKVSFLKQTETSEYVKTTNYAIIPYSILIFGLLSVLIYFCFIDTRLLAAIFHFIQRFIFPCAKYLTRTQFDVETIQYELKQQKVTGTRTKFKLKDLQEDISLSSHSTKHRDLNGNILSRDDVELKRNYHGDSNAYGSGNIATRKRLTLY